MLKNSCGEQFLENFICYILCEGDITYEKLSLLLVSCYPIMKNFKLSYMYYICESEYLILNLMYMYFG
jgi:hypothetical protein